MTTTHAPPAIELRGLTKRFGARVAVDRLDLDVPSGAVAGLIGPNGAGKTTVMAMLLGLVRPSGGSGHVLGHPIDDPAAYLGRVGAMIEAPAFQPGLTGTDNLRVLARLGGHDRHQIAALLELVGLGARGGDRYGRYSLGMKQRLGIAAALLGDPQLVILDEPTNGVDPSGMRDIRAMIARIAAGGRTVLVSSHLLGELDQVCDWLVMIDRGGLVHQGPAAELGAGEQRLVLRPRDGADLDRLRTIAVAALGTERDRIATERDDNAIALLVGERDGDAIAAAVNRSAHDAGIVLAEIRHDRPDLESRYLAIVGEKGEEIR